MAARRATTPNRWARIDALFEACVELEPGARRAQLERACAGEPTLRQALEELLQAHDEGGSFLDRPLETAQPPEDEGPWPRALGPYRLIERLGRGGMGDVYLAERVGVAPAEQVALKLVRPGLDLEPIRRRFESERRILATLAHVNIARLIDAGQSPDGRPYFVLEYVRGRPIDEHCSRAALDLAARVELFAQVCLAAHHAHRHDVVHRDLKPSNILVTDSGVPKLIDFGIAKLRRPRAGGRASTSTVTALGVMTPDYASPEQILGGEVTPRSDVYSLGVVLYELLTGRPPHRLSALKPQELVRTLCQDEAPAPSAVFGTVPLPAGLAAADAQALARHLDAIVLKALHPAPQERHDSAELLGCSLRRACTRLRAPEHGPARWLGALLERLRR